MMSRIKEINSKCNLFIHSEIRGGQILIYEIISHISIFLHVIYLFLLFIKIP